MGSNEMETKIGPPQSVRLSEGLGVTALTPASGSSLHSVEFQISLLLADWLLVAQHTLQSSLSTQVALEEVPSARSSVPSGFRPRIRSVRQFLVYSRAARLD